MAADGADVRAGIRYARDGHVARVTIDRPEVLNAIDPAAAARLEQIWEEVEADGDVRVVVLTGAGTRAFCVGADLSAGAGPAQQSRIDRWSRANPNGFAGLTLRESLDVPVIARVDGYALGGGLELLLGCDVVIASERSTFGLPEPRVGGLPSEGGVLKLTRRLSHQQAMGLLLTGRRVSARELERIGIVNEVTDDPELDEAVERWVADVLACAPLALRAIKQIAARADGLPVHAAHRTLVPALLRTLTSEDGDEGVAAFREKRRPVWRGR